MAPIATSAALNRHLELLLGGVYDGALAPAHRADLTKSGITDETMALHKIMSVPPSMIDPLLGVTRTPKVRSAYLIPFPDPCGGWMNHTKLKVFLFDEETADVRGDHVEQQRDKWRYNGGRQKYFVAKRSSPRVFFPIPAMRQALESYEPLWICEGMKKALSAAQLGLPAIAIESAWSWHRKGSRDLLPDFDLIAMQGRTVKVVPDADAQSNPYIAWAIHRMAEAFERRGGRVPDRHAAAQGRGMKIDDMIEAGAGPADIEALPTITFTPQIAPEAFHGLAGRIVKAIEPYSEADPVAILSHVLVATGNMIGRGPHALVEKTEHTCGEFVVLVGDSAKGRKGQAWSTPRYLLSQADEMWAKTRIKSGLSSGEGLIANVRDERWGLNRKGERVLEDEGELDKRLLVIEPELATILRRMLGETNSLSAVIREAWETGNLSTLTKNTPLKATGAHVSIIAHTTREELVTSLTEADRVNGFANRFIYLLVRRSKCLPEPAPVPDAVLAPLIRELRDVAQARRHTLVRDHEARALWATIYPALSEGEPGLLGAVLARAEAHVLRLSVLYAVLDRAAAIQPDHLRAALAIWDYSEASARRIFGERLGLCMADVILANLRT